MQNIQKLIEECSKAEGPIRELDCKIWELFHGDEMDKSLSDRLGDWSIRYYPGPPGPEYHRLPKYTKSIDDALTLIPEKWTRAVDATSPETGIDVDLYSPMDEDDNVFRGSHKLEALATCIAAMKVKNANSLPKHQD